MSKRNQILIIIAAVVLIIVAAFVLLVRSKSASTGTGTNNNPFGAGSGDSNIQFGSNSTTNEPENGSSIAISYLNHLSTSPIAGAIAIQTPTTTVARYVDRATAHVFSVDLNSGMITESANTTIPKIYQALWIPGGTTVALRYLGDDNETIQTYSAKLVIQNSSSFGTSTTQTPFNLQGTFLPANISGLAIAPNGSKVFYLTGSAGNTHGTTANPDGSKAAALLTSSINEWIPTWPNISTITLTTKASSDVDGFMYFVNTKTGGMTKVLGNIGGLTTLTSPDTARVAYSSSNNVLEIYSLKTANTLFTNVSTLAEKCVWSVKNPTILYCAVPSTIPAGSYPDSWYQGLVSFSDNIYKIDTTANSSTIVGNLIEQYRQDIDAVNLTLSPNENYLLFTNKKDQTLWGLQLGTTTIAQ